MASRGCDALGLQRCLLPTDETLCSTLWCCVCLHCMMCRQAKRGGQRSSLTLCHVAVVLPCLSECTSQTYSTQMGMQEIRGGLRLPPTSSSCLASLALASFVRRLTSARLLWSSFSSSLSSSKGVLSRSKDSSLQPEGQSLEASAIWG